MAPFLVVVFVPVSLDPVVDVPELCVVLEELPVCAKTSEPLRTRANASVNTFFILGVSLRSFDSPTKMGG